MATTSSRHAMAMGTAVQLYHMYSEPVQCRAYTPSWEPPIGAYRLPIGESKGGSPSGSTYSQREVPTGEYKLLNADSPLGSMCSPMENSPYQREIISRPQGDTPRRPSESVDFQVLAFGHYPTEGYNTSAADVFCHSCQHMPTVAPHEIIHLQIDWCAAPWGCASSHTWGGQGCGMGLQEQQGFVQYVKWPHMARCRFQWPCITSMDRARRARSIEVIKGQSEVFGLNIVFVAPRPSSPICECST
jgi:hypothetical protein